MGRIGRSVCSAGLAFVGALALLATSPSLPETRDAKQERKTVKCCFTNPGYHGVCVVEPKDNETCESILAYLNNPNSQGKSYCGNTNVRGGWQQVPCEEKTADP